MLLFAAIVFTVARPQYAIVLLLLLYPMEQVMQANIPQLGAAPWLINVIVGLLVLFGSFRALIGAYSPFTGYLNPVMGATAALYAVTFVGVLLGPDVAGAFDKLRSASPYLALLLIFPTLLVTRLEDWRRIIVPTLAGGSAVLVLMLLSPRTVFAGARLIIDLEDVVGGAGNPLATAQLGGLIAIFGVLYKSERGGQVLLLIRIAAIGLGLSIAALSGSRGQLIASIAASLICFPLARQVRNPVQFVGTVVSSFVFLAVGYAVLGRVLSGRAGERWGAEALQDGVDSRLYFATEALMAWAQNPAAWPLGTGTFSSGALIAALEDTYIHNSVVQVIAENGVIGFTLFATAMWLTYRAGMRLVSLYSNNPGLRSAAACLIAMCIYEFLLSLKQGDFVATGAPFWTFLIVGKLAAAEQAFGHHEIEHWDYEDDGYTEADEPHHNDSGA
ncbi:MAG: O-antigen ligase family protein [Planctomycetota bacterium]